MFPILWCQISHNSELLDLLSVWYRVLLLNAISGWNENLYTLAWWTPISLAEEARVPLGHISTCSLLNNTSYPLSSSAQMNLRFFFIPCTYRTYDTFKGVLGPLSHVNVPTPTSLTMLLSPSTTSISVSPSESSEKYYDSCHVARSATVNIPNDTRCSASSSECTLPLNLYGR